LHLHNCITAYLHLFFCYTGTPVRRFTTAALHACDIQLLTTPIVEGLILKSGIFS